jgi:ABC-2 type transport system permease protein
MKQFKTVFSFELFNYLRRKSYIAVTLVMIAIVIVLLCIPVIQQAFSADTLAEASAETQTVAYVDASGQPDGTGALDRFNSALAEDGIEMAPVDADEGQLAEMVDNEEYSFAVIRTGPLSYTRYVRNITMYDMFDSKFSGVLLDQYKYDALLALGVSQSDARQLDEVEVVPDVRTTETGKDQSETFFYTYILIFALYMSIVIYGQFVASSVAAEKSSRAMELLITSANPKSLIFGKVLGTGTAGLLQFALILGCAALFYNANAALYEGSWLIQSMFSIPPPLVLYTILFFVLGFFIYAFLYAALGSLVSRMEDLGAATQPVTWLFVVAFIVVIFSMNTGQIDNPAMVVCSFIPFTSPMAMFTRIAMGNVMPAEIVVSIAILIASCILIGWLATSIYRLGVLMYGKPPKLGGVFKMLRSARG